MVGIKRKRVSAKRGRPSKKARSVKGITQIVKRVVSNAAEHKMFSPALVQSTAPATAAVIDCCQVAQDDGEGGRVGNKITPKFLKFIGDFNLNAASATGIVVGRITVVQWFPPTTPTSASIYKTGGAAHLSMYNDDNGTNFRVLFDRRFAMTDAGNNRLQIFKGKCHPARGHSVITFDSDAVVTGSNKIYLLYSCSDNTNQAGFEVQTSLYYTDE